MTLTKLMYKPWGALGGILGGAIAAALFRRLWKLVSGDNETPSATDRSRGWLEVVLAATLEGAVYGATKALVDRGSAAGFAKAIGTWPDED